ncbi:LIM and SH3 domain protein Lasp [Pogonomyrmex barbatus]|uniref:LIM and SH3 domain protein Lasp n=1 Tax=Pogonomyrmex barbatus TaxID=144034 RepID=A0A6I9VYJ6_9HYME|nr:LIM and SH3 domain protein Lasp [Pogonomyrmex barbatus]
MSKTCARCEKTVYPIEELKCLDKIWHKQCFKCQGCGMTLNMRTYKGFNKQPYCEACEMSERALVLFFFFFFHIHDTFIPFVVGRSHCFLSKAVASAFSCIVDIEYVEYTDGTIAPASSINANPPPARTANSPVQRTPGRIADYDPLSEARPSPYSARQTATTVIYTSDKGPVTNPPTRKIGSVADIDPVNEYYGSLTPAMTINNNQHQHQPQHQSPPPPSNVGRVYRAMYDYEAQDLDEVSFCDGDLIVNCTAVDEGWMTGLVQRTGRHGMLPANYVEPAQI